MATPPDMARISPFAPDIIPIVFPTRVSPFPVTILSDTIFPTRVRPPVNVRTFSFPLNAFQSPIEREPVVVAFASLILIEVPAA